MVTLYSTATEYIANELTFLRGDSGDIASVHVHFDLDPNDVPAVGDFTEVTLVEAPDALADGDKVDVVTLVGPGNVGLSISAGDVELTAGDYQLFVMIVTASEIVIRSVDTVTIL